MSALGAVAAWPVGTAAVAVVAPGGVIDDVGPGDLVLPWASVTKVLTAVAAWVAIEEGTLALDEPAGPPGATIRHLLSHASGLAPDSDQVLGPPATRRRYSNRGIELVAERVAANAAMPFVDYLAAAALEPLGLRATALDGSPAAGAHGSLGDLARLALELLRPTLVSPSTLAEATEVAFPGLDGILPGFGRQSPNDWGLGVEIRGHKSPHWTATTGSPRTFGHFGQSGSFLWVDPDADLACCCLSDRPFGPWAATAWAQLADAVLAEHARPR
jgi:CubicO group peptidase (beta-lactamase class C family)